MYEDRGEPNISDEELEEVISEMKLLSKKWSLRIIISLMREERLSFKQIRERSNGVSNKVLAERLQQLQNGGILSKEEDSYVLTSKGEALEDLFEELQSWKQEHE